MCIGEVGRFGLGRLVGAQEGLDRALEGADAVDVRGDAEPVPQPLVIKMRPARPGERDAADRVGPNLARVRGDLIAVGRIGGGEGEHRFFRSEEHTSELKSIMRISYAGLRLNKKMLLGFT